MSDITIVVVAVTASVFILALTAMLLGRKLSFKMDLRWKAALVEFSASERRQAVAKTGE